MTKLDEQIIRCYFRLEEFQRHRIRMERLFHPERFKWSRGMPRVSRTKMMKQEELGRIGFGEDFYQRVLDGERRAKNEFEELVEYHPLWPYLEKVDGFGKYLGGAFIAACGDITRAETVSSFWKGMGLDVLPDGTVPRKVRGKTGVERRIPAYPHVTRIGEQIRQQMLRQNPFYQELYHKHKSDYEVRHPGRPRMFAHKHGLRIGQKVLYACLWEKFRQAYNLPAPFPYVFDILKHDASRRITIEDFWQVARASRP